jgi:predicted HAD superfamily hydrolase
MSKFFEVLQSQNGISSYLYETEDRDLFFESTLFENQLFKMINSIENNIYISLDIFDTLLLRNEKSEPYRFYEISYEIANFLNVHDVFEVLQARYLGIEITYAASKVYQGCREGSLYDIHKVMLNALNLPEELFTKTIQIEIDYEKKNLRLNRGLWDALMRLKQRKSFDIILVSDMYKHSEQLSILLKYFIPDYEQNIKHLFTSADTIISKHSGKIFKYIEKELKTDSSAILHMCDNLRSDYQNPKRAVECSFFTNS